MSTSHTINLLEHMYKTFEINRTKSKGGCQSESNVVTHNSKSDLHQCIIVVPRRDSARITLENPYVLTGNYQHQESFGLVKNQGRGIYVRLDFMQ